MLDSDKPVTWGLFGHLEETIEIELRTFYFLFYRKGQDLDSSVLDFVSWVLLVSTAKKEPANQRLIVNEYACTGTNSWIFVNTHVQTLAGHGQESNLHWTHTSMHTDKGSLNRPLLELIIKYSHTWVNWHFHLVSTVSTQYKKKIEQIKTVCPHLYPKYFSSHCPMLDAPGPVQESFGPLKIQ